LSLADRQRKHEQTHQRTLEQQILDALLRIEELLQEKASIDDGQTYSGEDVQDVIKNVKPQETPFSKAVAKKPTGARKVDRL
jgi:hypothetical protein